MKKYSQILLHTYVVLESLKASKNCSPQSHFSFNVPPEGHFWYLRAVVLNRGAAESSRGAANFWTWLVNCSKGCRQIVKKLRKGAANQKRLRNTALGGFEFETPNEHAHSHKVRQKYQSKSTIFKATHEMMMKSTISFSLLLSIFAVF